MTRCIKQTLKLTIITLGFLIVSASLAITFFNQSVNPSISNQTKTIVQTKSTQTIIQNPNTQVVSSNDVFFSRAFGYDKGFAHDWAYFTDQELSERAKIIEQTINTKNLNQTTSWISYFLKNANQATTSVFNSTLEFDYNNKNNLTNNKYNMLYKFNFNNEKQEIKDGLIVIELKPFEPATNQEHLWTVINQKINDFTNSIPSYDFTILKLKEIIHQVINQNKKSIPNLYLDKKVNENNQVYYDFSIKNIHVDESGIVIGKKALTIKEAAIRIKKANTNAEVNPNVYFEAKDITNSSQQHFEFNTKGLTDSELWRYLSIPIVLSSLILFAAVMLVIFYFVKKRKDQEEQF